MFTHFTEESVPDQSNKTILITGANTGIGYETARVLAAKGARVLLGCRSAGKAADARQQMLKQYPNAEIEFVPMDLANLYSIEDAAKWVNDSEEKLDVLINNAGIMMTPREETEDGFESQFGVNHLGHFALTGLLLDKIRNTPNARIVNVSSIGHRGGFIAFNDLRGRWFYNRFARYAMSKLANLLFTYELQRRLEAANDSTLSAACHPGVSDTELTRYLPAPMRAMMPVARNLMPMQSAAMGALPTLRAATAPDVNSGEYYGPDGPFELTGYPVQVKSNWASHNQWIARRLWDVSIELTGVDPDLTPA